MEDMDHSNEHAQRDRERSNRGDKPSRFSDASRDRDRDRSPANRDRNKRSSGKRVYVSNISYEYRWQELKDIFRTHVGEVSFVELFVDENEKPKGCGLVEFSDPSSVKKCLEVMHRMELKGRRLVIKEDFAPERDKHGNAIASRRNRDREREEKRELRRDNWVDNSSVANMYNRLLSDSSESKMGPTWGLSPQFLESLGINKPLVNRVFVANVDYKVDEKKLREIFKLAGKIVDLELARDKDGNSRGFALVDYDHPVEAVQAISMFHNQFLYDRQMTVRMDRIDQDTRIPEGLRGIGMGLGVNGEPLRDVSRHLPSTNCSLSDLGGLSNAGAGILGAMPNAGLQNLSSALSNVVNTPGLASLASLQGLTEVQTQLLANELGLGNMNNSLVGQSSSMSGFGNQGGQNNMSSYNNDNQYGRNNQGSKREYNSNRDYDTTMSIRNSYDLKQGHDYRDGYRQQSGGDYRNDY